MLIVSEDRRTILNSEQVIFFSIRGALNKAGEALVAHTRENGTLHLTDYRQDDYANFAFRKLIRCYEHNNPICTFYEDEVVE